MSKSNVVRMEGQERGAAFVDFVKPRWLDVWDKPTTRQDFEAVKVQIYVKNNPPPKNECSTIELSTQHTNTIIRSCADVWCVSERSVLLSKCYTHTWLMFDSESLWVVHHKRAKLKIPSFNPHFPLTLLF